MCLSRSFPLCFGSFFIIIIIFIDGTERRNLASASGKKKINEATQRQNKKLLVIAQWPCKMFTLTVYFQVCCFSLFKGSIFSRGGELERNILWLLLYTWPQTKRVVFATVHMKGKKCFNKRGKKDKFELEEFGSITLEFIKDSNKAYICTYGQQTVRNKSSLALLWNPHKGRQAR